MSDGWIAATNVLAILVSPLVALGLTRWRDKVQRQRGEKLWVFRTLMATRAAILDVQHVQALNTIDVVFATESQEDREIREAWGIYLLHLRNAGYPEPAREERRKELLTEMLVKMGQALGYHFDRAHIANNGYYPDGYLLSAQENMAVRRGVIQMLLGNRPLWVTSNQPAGSIQFGGGGMPANPNIPSIPPG